MVIQIKNHIVAELRPIESGQFRVMVIQIMDRLPRIAWIVSLEALGSTLLRRLDQLPWSALIASLGARGSPPSERVRIYLVSH